jgi:hypothetical protein
MDDFDIEETFDNSIKLEEENMDEEENILKQIDRKIILKFMKEVKTSRTYIFGLDNYIKTKEEKNEFIKHLKKALGTSFIEKDSDDGKAYGFAGDHINYIYSYIIKKNICPKNEIKK